MSLVDVLAGGRIYDLDASALPDLQAIRRHGPARVRRAALIALVHVGGEKALDSADVDVLQRLITIKRSQHRPHPIDACFNSWLAVPGGDQQGIMRVLGLTRSVPVTYALGETLVCHLGHGGPDDSRPWRHVFVSPQLNGWTVVYGPSCNPDGEPQVETWVHELSSMYGQAQAYFFGSQNDGDAWLVGSRGRIIRRFSSNDPDTSTGDPLPIEVRTLERLGASGRPEQFDPHGDVWFDFGSECGALQVAAELSIDPVWGDWPPDLDVRGHPFVAWPDSDDEVSILRGCYTFAL